MGSNKVLEWKLLHFNMWWQGGICLLSITMVIMMTKMINDDNVDDDGDK